MKLFSQNEMLRRVAALRVKMDRLELDASLTTSFHNTLYYTGFWMFPFGRFFGSVIPRDGDVALIAPELNQARATEISWVQDMKLYRDQTSTIVAGIEQIKKVFLEQGLAAKRVGLEEDTLPQRTLRLLVEAFPGTEFEDISDVMMRQRIFKSEEEIEVLRQIAEMSDVAVGAYVYAAKEGETESGISSTALAALDAEIAGRYPGLETFGSNVYCESGMRTLSAHGLATGRKIRRGDNVVLNVLANFAGYYISNERTIFVGPVPDHMRKPFEATMEAHEWMLQAIRPRVKCSDVARGVSDILDQRGVYGRYQRHGPGHDVGILGFFWGRGEMASIRDDNHISLQPGMTVTVEPGIYVPDIGGFRHCDVVVVTEEGNEILTKFRRGEITVG